jgi:uncharacterized integral membrane protein
MKIHRAVTLVLMMTLAVVMLAAMTAGSIGTFSGSSLVALIVVVLAAAVAGVAFSFSRYFRRR